ncbi:MAG TPA: ATP-binding protein [Anaeromyxobacter sp.]|nr:ATP-binding protein [Anaeromyxobacter sp.]
MSQRPQPDEPFFDGEKTAEPSPGPWRHETLRRNLLVVMLCLTLAPLAIAGSVGFFQFRALIHREEMNQLRWHAERAVHTFELYLDGLKHDLIVLASSYTTAELADRERLEEALARLKGKHPGLVDLSLIDPDGVQIAYAGPYGLAGKEYTSSPWYARTLARKVHVSEVFMGFRNVPHFVVAASKKEPPHPGSWVVRASVDAESLERFLGTLGSEALDDVFLVSEDGVLQTSSRFYGKASSPFALSALGPKSIDVAEVTRGSAPVLRATAHVQSAPWVLVLEQDKYGEARLWSAFRANLVAVSVVTAIVAALAIVAVAKSVADRIRDAEQAREALIKETEHTSKLASIGRLAAGVAHEINNPLAIISEKAGLVKDMMLFAGEMPQRQKFLSEIGAVEEAVNRARVITHRLLGFARRMDVPLQAVRVNDVVREVIGFLEKEATYRGIVIEQDLDPEVPVIQSDTGQLQQVFLNIVNNAIDAVERGGRIQIASRVDAGAVYVDVKDDGPGMPPDVLEKIFDPFFTTKSGAERHGTGLGLSITYGLVKKLGGRIGVRSAVGSGTVFRVTLPAPPAPPPRHVEASGDA